MRILLAIDGSKCSGAVTHAVIAQCKPGGAEVRVAHVVELPTPWFGPNMVPRTVPGLGVLLTEMKKRGKSLVEAATKKLAAAGFKTSAVILEGDPKICILDAAQKWRAELIVVGSHGRGGFDRFLLGSVSDAVVHHAHCSVQVVRVRE